MRRIASSLLLTLLCGIALTGCIDISTHYIIRKDGTSGVRYDLVMDKTIMQLMGSFQSLSSSSPDSAAMARAMSKMSKETVDSFRTQFFGAEIARLQTMRGVRSVRSRDSLAYDGVHMILECEFDSYKQFALLHSKDTAKSKFAFHFGDSLSVAEQGDSIQFLVADLSMLGGSDAFKDLDFLKETEGWFKKTRVHRPKPASHFHEAMWRPTVDTPDVYEPNDSVQIDPDIVQAPAGSSTVDSSSNKLAMLGMMMKLFLTMDLSIESPLITSYPASAEYDPAKHEAVWHIDLSSVMGGMTGGSTDDMKYYVWFKRP